jgi:hypothetical protein
MEKSKMILLPISFILLLSCKIDDRNISRRQLNTPELIFKSIDNLDAGHVDIYQWKRVYGNDSQSVKLFSHYDKNHDGLLERREFMETYSEDASCANQYNKNIEKNEVSIANSNNCYLIQN